MSISGPIEGLTQDHAGTMPAASEGARQESAVVQKTVSNTVQKDLAQVLEEQQWLLNLRT